MLKKGSFLRELPVIIIAALVVSIIVKTFLVHFFYIPSGSMENTLQVGDRIAVNKLGALFTDIKRGEVVVFGDPDNWLGNSSQSEDSGIGAVVKTGLITVGVLPDPAKQYLIKRVIGVGGDNVVCCDKAGKIQVNGVSIRFGMFKTEEEAYQKRVDFEKQKMLPIRDKLLAALPAEEIQQKK